MGGSAAKPSDLDLKQSVSSSAAEKEQLYTNMRGDLFNLKRALDCWEINPIWYRHSALYYAGMLKNKMKTTLMPLNNINDLLKALEKHTNIFLDIEDEMDLFKIVKRQVEDDYAEIKAMARYIGLKRKWE